MYNGHSWQSNLKLNGVSIQLLLKSIEWKGKGKSIFFKENIGDIPIEKKLYIPHHCCDFFQLSIEFNSIL